MSFDAKVYLTVLVGISGLWLCSCVKGQAAEARRETATPAPVANNNPTNNPQGVSSDRLLKHIQLLAHDQLEGRGTGSRGIDIAAGYIAGQFAAMGLVPGGDQGTYFQNFTIPSDPEISKSTRFLINDREPLNLLTDYVPLGVSSQGTFEGELVFAGYAITDESTKRDDYDGLDVNGKVVIAFRGQPPVIDGQASPRERAMFDRKIKGASERGAVAILFVNQVPIGEKPEELLPFGGRRGRTGMLPALHVSRAVVDELLAAENQPNLTELQTAIDAGEKISVQLPATVVSGTVEFQQENWPSRNVLAMVPGNGPNADQVVVIGAHYDHLGLRDGQIYNGADDNASGTAGVIEVCGEVAKAQVRDRSLLCMTFTGEEIGLLGSEHYVKHPTVSNSNIVAMINMDMIGRWTPNVEANELAVQGLGTGDIFKDIVEQRARQAGINYIPDQSAKGPSDHASFYEADIPSLFFFTGVHSDYHRPGDDTEKVNAEGAARIATMVSQITLDLLNANAPPKFAEVESAAVIFRGPKPSPVVMGIMPGRSEDPSQPGWPIAEVVDGGGAARAGMKSGDRILSVDGHSIGGIGDYYKATEKKKGGDVVAVIVRRGTVDLTLQVELAARP